MNSETVEDYLKAIYELQELEDRAKTSRLAEKLGVTAGTVTEMLKRLSLTDSPLVTYKHHHGVQLTAMGKNAALDIIRRHRLLETFLHDVLGLSWEEVHREAEVLEHHISKRVTDAIESLLNLPQFDPHGEPIPDRRGKLPAISETRLSDVRIGESVKIIRVQPYRDDLLPYLNDLGIGIDTIGVVIEKAPMNGPISIQIGKADKTVTRILGRNIADHLFVDVLNK